MLTTDDVDLRVLLDAQDLAGWLGVSLRTVQRWVEDGELPPPITLGSKRFWHRGVLLEWFRRVAVDLTFPAADNPTFRALPR